MGGLVSGAERSGEVTVTITQDATELYTLNTKDVTAHFTGKNLVIEPAESYQ